MLSTYIKLLLTSVCWGVTFIAGKNLAQHVGPLTGAFLRFLVACVFLTALMLRQEKKLIRPGRNNLLMLFLMGMTGIFLYNFFPERAQADRSRPSLHHHGHQPDFHRLMSAVFSGSG
jgi:drug/metabolite transporter (DMT)-like permease